MFNKNSRSLNDPVVRERNKEVRKIFVKHTVAHVATATAVCAALYVVAKKIETKENTEN
jgi:hypothetical protein